MLLAGIGIGDDDGAIERTEARGIRHPAAVGAPRRRQRTRGHHPRIAADDLGLAAGHVEYPHVQVRIAVEQLGAVGRPGRRVVARGRVEQNLPRRRDAVLRLDHQPVLARRVAEIRHVFAVGRPGGLAVGRGARRREIAHVALVGRYREDLTAGFDHHALAGRRQPHVRDATGHVLPVRHHPREVAHGPDRHHGRLAGLHVELVDVAALLEDQRAATRAERLHVEVGKARQLRELLGGGRERPHVRHPVAIRQEVHGIAEPHRVDLLGARPRRRDDVVRREVGNPDGLVLAALVIASLFVPRVVHAVGDARAIRRQLALIAARQRQRRLGAAGRRHGPEARRGRGRSGRARRREEHAGAVGRPALHDIGAGMPREPRRVAAVDRHHVDVGGAGVVGAERERAAVG